MFEKIAEIAKKYNLSFLEIVILFLSHIAVNNLDFEKVALKLFDLKNLKKDEIEALRKFFEYLKESEDVDEFVENVLKYIDDFNKASEEIVLFFTIFLPQDVLFSKDPEKIKTSLNKYPSDIKEAILKSFELLSAVKLVDEDIKKEIVKEVLRIVFILSKIVRLLDDFK